MWAAKIGALAYALLSILHIVLGVSRLSERAADGTLSEAAGRLAQGGLVPPASIVGPGLWLIGLRSQRLRIGSGERLEMNSLKTAPQET